jgi:hypothetical protein
MRLRRETGFSINFSIIGRECQIRKGLSAEDLIGAVIKNSILNKVLIGVVTGTEKNTDTGAIILKCADAAAKDGAEFVYDPATGIVKYMDAA